MKEQNNAFNNAQDTNNKIIAFIPPGTDLNKLALDDSDFPLDVFPAPFAEFISECNKALNFPIDYTGAAVISAVSTIIGKSAKLKVKNEWYEFPALYMAIIGNAGANKSHPLDLAFKPFQDIDKAMSKKFEQEFNAWQAFQDLPRKEKKDLLSPEKPKLIKSILHNFTPEILHQRLADNQRGCNVVSEELATFLEGMNNYSKGDQTSMYLSFWSNKPTSVDRVSKPIPLYIPEPFFNIIGTLQPRVLGKLFPTTKSDNGFLQRFLFAYPGNAEKQPVNDNEVEESIINDYVEWFEYYEFSNPINIDPQNEKPKPKLYYLSEGAKAYWQKWNATNCTKVNQNANTLKAEILTKFDNHFLRLSLILQIMDDYHSNEISIKAVEGAAKLCTYFINSAMKVLEVLENVNPADILNQEELNFFNNLPYEFSTAKAKKIGVEMGLGEKHVQRFLQDNKWLTKKAHGQYTKKLRK